MNSSESVENNHLEDNKNNQSSAIDFTISISELLKALGHVQSVVERKNTIAILSNVKLDVNDNSLSLTATDLEIAITEKIDADVSISGSLTVPAHTLYDIIRKLPDGDKVRFKGNAFEDGKLQVTSDSCKFSLSCLPANEFPIIEKGNMDYNFELSPSEIINIIDKTRFAISNEETRYFLNGIYARLKLYIMQS